MQIYILLKDKLRHIKTLKSLFVQKSNGQFQTRRGQNPPSTEPEGRLLSVKRGQNRARVTGYRLSGRLTWGGQLGSFDCICFGLLTQAATKAPSV